MSARPKKNGFKGQRKHQNTIDDPQLSTLIEMFPDWQISDLKDALGDNNGDIQTVILKITDGSIAKWDEVKKPSVVKKSKEEHFGSSTTITKPKKDRPTRGSKPSVNGGGKPVKKITGDKKQPVIDKKKSSSEKPVTEEKTEEKLENSASEEQEQHVSSSAPAKSSWASALSKPTKVIKKKPEPAKVVEKDVSKASDSAIEPEKHEEPEKVEKVEKVVEQPAKIEEKHEKIEENTEKIAKPNASKPLSWASHISSAAEPKKHPKKKASRPEAASAAEPETKIAAVESPAEEHVVAADEAAAVTEAEAVSEPVEVASPVETPAEAPDAVVETQTKPVEPVAAAKEPRSRFPRRLNQEAPVVLPNIASEIENIGISFGSHVEEAPAQPEPAPEPVQQQQAQQQYPAAHQQPQQPQQQYPNHVQANQHPQNRQQLNHFFNQPQANQFPDQAHNPQQPQQQPPKADYINNQFFGSSYGFNNADFSGYDAHSYNQQQQVYSQNSPMPANNGLRTSSVEGYEQIQQQQQQHQQFVPPTIPGIAPVDPSSAPISNVSSEGSQVTPQQGVAATPLVAGAGFGGYYPYNYYYPFYQQQAFPNMQQSKGAYGYYQQPQMQQGQPQQPAQEMTQATAADMQTQHQSQAPNGQYFSQQSQVPYQYNQYSDFPRNQNYY